MDLEVRPTSLLRLTIGPWMIYEKIILYIQSEFNIKWSCRTFSAICPAVSTVLMVYTQRKVFGSKKAIYQKIYTNHQLSGCCDIPFSGVSKSVCQWRPKWDRVFEEGNQVDDFTPWICPLMLCLNPNWCGLFKHFFFHLCSDTSNPIPVPSEPKQNHLGEHVDYARQCRESWPQTDDWGGEGCSRAFFFCWDYNSGQDTY